MSPRAILNFWFTEDAALDELMAQRLGAVPDEEF
jgi:hypothetical protein